MMMKKLMRWCFALVLAAREWWWWRSWWDDVLHWYWRPGRGLHLGRLGCTLLPTGAELHCDAHSTHSTTIFTAMTLCYKLHLLLQVALWCTISYKLHSFLQVALRWTLCTAVHILLQVALLPTPSYRLHCNTHSLSICNWMHSLLQVAVWNTLLYKLPCSAQYPTSFTAPSKGALLGFWASTHNMRLWAHID